MTEIINGILLTVFGLACVVGFVFLVFITNANEAKIKQTCVEQGGIYDSNQCMWSKSLLP